MRAFLTSNLGHRIGVALAAALAVFLTTWQGYNLTFSHAALSAAVSAAVASLVHWALLFIQEPVGVVNGVTVTVPSRPVADVVAPSALNNVPPSPTVPGAPAAPVSALPPVAPPTDSTATPPAAPPAAPTV